MNHPTNSRRISIKFVWLLGLTFFIFSNFAFAQLPETVEPRREQLLNGLKIMFFNEPKSEIVTLKLRINSGSAFDPLGKEGVMKLAARTLFDDGIRALFTEEYSGNLEVTSNYDFIQINASGRGEHLTAMLDILQNAVINFPPPAERFKEERAKLLAEVIERQKNPAIIADEAAAKRLFGSFPYGRSEFGTPETLAKIDRPDLVAVREKFFTSDNAVLAISGNIAATPTLRALKQFFGAWQKADKLVPATFRQPDAPKPETLIIEMPNIEKSYSRSARSVVGRSDKDFLATKIVTKVWQNKYCLDSESGRGELKYEPYFLRGVFVIRQTITTSQSEQLPINTYSRSPCGFIFLVNGKPSYPAITQNDFEVAKAKVVAEFQQKLQSNSSLVDWWLDVETYKLPTVKAEQQALQTVTLADVQKVAETLQNEPKAVVSVVKSGSEKKQ